MELAFQIASVVSASAALLLGGLFWTFSDFLMRSFDKSEGHTGIEAMRVLNREILRSPIIVMFMAMVPASLGMIGWAVFAIDHPTKWAAIAGAVLYLVGVFVVTAACNVPRNERLEGMASDSEEAAAYWRDHYLAEWTRWNSVRTVACVASAASFLAVPILL